MSIHPQKFTFVVSSYKCSDISYHIPPQDAILLLSCSSVNPPSPVASGPTRQLLLYRDSHVCLSQTCIKLSNVISHQLSRSFSKTLPVVARLSSRPMRHVGNGQRILSRHLAGFVRIDYWVCHHFLHALVLRLVIIIKALDRASPNNWLDDNIWLKKAYHEWRSPLLIHSNWWLAFTNDPNVPREVLLGRAHGQEIEGIGLSYWQVRRAASLVHRVLDFKAQLERSVPAVCRSRRYTITNIRLRSQARGIPRNNKDRFVLVVSFFAILLLTLILGRHMVPDDNFPDIQCCSDT